MPDLLYSVAHVQQVRHLGLDQAKVACVQHGAVFANPVGRVAFQYVKHLEEVVVVGQGGRVAVVLEYVDAVPLIRRKIPILQVFRRNGLGPFRHQQVVPGDLLFVDMREKLLKADGRGFSQSIIPVEDFAAVQRAQIVQYGLLSHGYPSSCRISHHHLTRQGSICQAR